MSFLNRLAPKEPEAGEPGLKDRGMILAYLEDLARTRTEVTLEMEGSGATTFAAFIDLAREDKRTFLLTTRRTLPPDCSTRTRFLLLFHLDGTRLQTEVAFLGRGGYMQTEFALPDVIRFAERRNKLRARFGPREKARVTVLQGLFDGKGVSGKLLDLSMEGLCLQVERALEIQGNRRLRLSAGLFDPGDKLMLVKIQDLPNTPELECTGRVAYLASEGELVRLGIQCSGFSPQQNRCLELVLGRRLPGFSRSFPVRHRRYPGAANEDPPEELAVRRDTFEEPHSLPMEALPELSEPARNDRAGRAHAILLILADSLDRAVLAGALRADGYTNVMEANSLVQALDRYKKQIPHLLLVDSHVGPHTAPDLVQKLRSLDALADVPAVVLLDAGDVKVKLAAKGQGIREFVAKPVDYDGQLRGVLEGMLKA